jgi:uncharacterized protein (DUF1015 family)
MATVVPFQPYRYAEGLAPLENLVTQPYDKISPAMQARYLSLHPNNLVRLILGERFSNDTATNNVYTRSADLFKQWVKDGILIREDAPSFYAYYQEFKNPDSGERLTRKGFIGLGAVEDYSAGTVHRHEQTLTGPKKDRWELLEHTRAFFEQIFMVYPDPSGAVDALLDQQTQGAPAAQVADEYGTIHRMWRISDALKIGELQRLMSDKKLVIADGHHRYETAVAFRQAHPELADAGWVTMNFVNMHSPGLKILATHRVVSALNGFKPERLVERASRTFKVTQLGSVDDLRRSWSEPHAREVRIGAVVQGQPGVTLFTTPRSEDTLDVPLLHSALLRDALDISDEAVRDEKHIRYVRGLDAAVDEVTKGNAQIAFLLEPTTIDQVARVSFSGGVMPQKSTDFYPKLLSGLTIYRMER